MVSKNIYDDPSESREKLDRVEKVETAKKNDFGVCSNQEVIFFELTPANWASHND